MTDVEQARTAMLIGTEGIKKLKNSHIAVFGLGGVGSYAAESLARSGVGKLTLIDGDVIAPSNLNRQLYALHSTIGLDKAEVAKARIADIDPGVEVTAKKLFFLPECADAIDFSKFSYVIDAVDTVTAKLEIIVRCLKNNVPVISSMGTGNKLNSSMLRVADISETKICPLAKVMRRELKKRGIYNLPVVYSEETPLTPKFDEFSPNGKLSPASMAFVPASAGLLLAAQAVKCLLDKD